MTLVKLVSERLHLSTDHIADHLVVGIVEPSGDMKLSRWEFPVISVGLSVSPEVQAELVLHTLEQLNELFSRADRSLALCARTGTLLEINKLGPLSQIAECLEKPTDIDLFISSVNDARTANNVEFPSVRAQGYVRSMWESAQAAMLRDPTDEFCVTGVNLSSVDGSIVSGGAVMRVFEGKGEASRHTLSKCIDTIRYGLLGSIPVEMGEVRVFVAQLLELLYSADLSVGQSKQEVKGILERALREASR